MSALSGHLVASGLAALRILLVEDDRMAAMMLGDQLHSLGHQVETAENGAEAYAMLREDATRCDLVITDRFMPALDGLGLTRRLRREPATKALPVIMLTGSSDAHSMAEGIEAGVLHYLTKPVETVLLRQVLDMAHRQIEQKISAASALAAHQSAFANIARVDFTLRQMSEVGPVSSLLSSLSPRAERILPALRELLNNGIEHGLYRLGNADKQAHLQAGTLQQELDRRKADPAYAGQIEAAAHRIEGGLRFAVRDPGPGFPWQRYIRPDAARSATGNGRGLARAGLIFDKLEFHGSGNLVTAIVLSEARKIW